MILKKSYDTIVQLLRNINAFVTEKTNHDIFLQILTDSLEQLPGLSGAWSILIDEDKNIISSCKTGDSSILKNEYVTLNEANPPIYITESIKNPGTVIITDDGIVSTTLHFDKRLYGVVCLATELPSTWTNNDTENLLELGNYTAKTLTIIDKNQKEREKLHVNVEKYRALYENAPQAYQSLNSDGYFIDINPGWLRILGYERSEVLGKRFPDFLHPDWQPHFEKNFPVFKKRGYVNDVQFKMRHKSGHYIFVEFNGCIGYYPDGKFRQTYCVFQDITKRKEAQEMLENERIRLQNIITGTNVGTWELNVQTGALAINERWAEIIGYTKKEIEPMTIETWYNFSHPDDISQCKAALNRHVLEETEYYEFEGRLQHKNSHWIWILGRGQVISKTAEGKPLMMMGTHLDVTERHLMQEQLRQSEKMDAIGQLAGGVAHDFNNQLCGILGFAELIADQTTDPELAKYAENIINASKRAAQLTNQLLAFGRKGKNLNVAIDIDSIIKDVTAMLERSIDKRIRIEVKPTVEDAIINGDPSQIYNALLNLALNSRDAIDDSGVISFETKKEYFETTFLENNKYILNPGDYLEIRISDTGGGMTKETQTRIFEPFFTTKKGNKGTGLGLSSVYGIVKNHGGIIRVYSEPGHGTTFRIYLPLNTDTINKKDEPQLPVLSGNGRILFVDDEEILRKLGSTTLKSLGYDVETCNDGIEAVNFYKNNWQNIDIVILDIIMPRMNGGDAFVEMKNINPKVKAILSSGYSINENVQQILDNGAMDFIVKPFERQKLSEVIERVQRERTVKNHQK